MSLKLKRLRAVILASDKIEADQLITYLSDGWLESTDNSIIYHATVVIGILEWTKDLHLISRAIGRFYKDNEPLSPPEELKFDVDVLDHNLFDIRFTMPFSEKIIFNGDGTENNDLYVECAKILPDLSQLLPK